MSHGPGHCDACLAVAAPRHLTVHGGGPSRRRGQICLALVALVLANLPACARQAASPTKAEEVGTAQTVLRRGPVTVHVEVSPEPARLSDEPVLTITIEAETGIQVQKPPFGDGIGDFLIRDFREPLLEVRDNREITRQIYTLEPTTTGSLLIDPIPIVFHDHRPHGDGKEHRIETEPLEVSVLSVVEGELPSLDDLAGMADPLQVEAPRNWGVAGWAATGATLLGLAGLAVFLWRRRHRPERTLSPHELALQELEALQRGSLGHRDVKRFYVELTGVVRRFIERTTGVQAAEQTTEEFLREISSGDQFARELRERLQHFLQSADLVKFAAHVPAENDVDEALQRARDFVRQPAPEEEPVS